MFSYLTIALVSLVLLWLVRKLLSLSANVAIAKTAGLPYAISRELMTYFPFFSTVAHLISALSGITGFFWTAIHDPVLSLLNALPYSRDWLWVMYVIDSYLWQY
jgi:hypothetical protein